MEHAVPKPCALRVWHEHRRDPRCGVIGGYAKHVFYDIWYSINRPEKDISFAFHSPFSAPNCDSVCLPSYKFFHIEDLQPCNTCKLTTIVATPHTRTLPPKSAGCYFFFSYASSIIYAGKEDEHSHTEVVICFFLVRLDEAYRFAILVEVTRCCVSIRCLAGVEFLLMMKHFILVVMGDNIQHLQHRSVSFHALVTLLRSILTARV